MRSVLMMKGLLEEYPHISVERVEILTNRARAKADGVRMIPALVAGDERLSGFLLTPGGMRRFFATAAEESGRAAPAPNR